MGCKHNGIDPSTDGKRTTLHSLENPQHCHYYCAFSSTSFPARCVQLTNILPIKENEPHTPTEKQATRYRLPLGERRKERKGKRKEDKLKFDSPIRINGTSGSLTKNCRVWTGKTDK